MRKFLKHFPLNKLFVSLFVILYTFVPSAQAMRVVAEDISVPVDTSEDILDEGISDPAEIANPNVLGEEVIQKVVPEATEPPFVYEDGVYTVNKVVVNEEYVYPDNSNVRVKFTSISEEGNLVISKVLLTEEEKSLLNTSDDYGWDIRSSMTNGSFVYDLTLPNNTKSNDVEVKYTEDGNTYNNIDNNLIVNENVIGIKGLEHFTVFVVVDSDTYHTPAEQNSACGAIYTSYGGCYTTIQQAVNESSNGGIIYVAPGTYNEYIFINGKAVSLIGSGADSTTIKPNTGGAVITINNSTTTTSMTIEGFTIDATIATSGILIQNGTSNVTVKNNKVINFTDKGVLISNGDNNFVLDNIITASTSGANAGVYVDDNNSGVDPISKNNLIDRNTVTLPTSGAGNLYNIHFAGYISGANTVSNNVLNGGKRSFQQDSGITGTVTFSGNTVNEPSIAGVYLNSGSANIINNTFNNSVRPIEFWAQDVNIQNNIFNGSTYDGINAHSFNSVKANYNAFSNIGFKAVNNRTSTGTIDATHNKWGTSKESVIQSMINGNVTYNPWYGKEVEQSLNVVNEYEKDGIYYVKYFDDKDGNPVSNNDFLDFKIVGEPIYHQRYIVGLWGYDGTTGSRDLNRYRGWENYSPDDNYLVNVDLSWQTVTDKYMGGNPPGTPIPAGDYILWAERYYEEGGYVPGSAITQRITIDNQSPTISDTKMYVQRGENWEESYLTKSGDKVKVSINVEDALTEVAKVQIWIREHPWNPNNNELISGSMTKIDPTHFEFIYTVPNTYKDGDQINQNFEGNYFNFRPYDVVGNSAIGWTKKFTIDNTAPSVPTGMYFTDKGSTEIKNCGDYTNSEYGSFIHWNKNTEEDFLKYEYISYNPDGSTGPIREFTTNEFDATWWKRPFDGQYGFQLRAVDNAGNKSDWSSTCNVNVDWEKPTGSIDSIYYSPKGMYVSHFITNDNTPEIYGTATDNSGIYSAIAKIGIHDGTHGSDGSGGGDIWWTGFSNPIPDGTYPIVLTITDLAGNETVVEGEITIDTKAPTALHKYLKNGIEITDSIAYVKGTSELTFLAEYFDEGSGIYQDSYVIFDSNEDGTARTSKAYCGWRNPGNTLLITGNPLTTPVPFTNCSATLPDGEYFMYHQVYDNATRQDIPEINQFRDYKGLHFIVDSQAPVVEITSPLNETNVNGTVDIKGSVQDENPDHYYLVIKNASGDIVAGPTPSTVYRYDSFTDESLYQWDTTQGDDGQYTISLAAKDAAGNRDDNISLDEISVTVDNTAPTVPVLEYPIDGVYIKDNTPLMQWANSTDDTDVAGYYYRVYYNCSDVNDPSTCSSVYPNSTGLWGTNSEYQAGTTNDGTYYWQVKAVDTLGNESNWSDLEKVVIDTQKPDAPEIEYPTNNSYLNSAPILNDWTDSTDPNFDHYEVKYVRDNDGGEVYKDESLSWRNHTPSDSNQTGFKVYVRAIDKAGNTGEWSDPVYYIYDITPPDKPESLYYVANGEVLSCNTFTSSYDIIAEWENSTDDVTAVSHYEYQSFNPDNGWIWPHTDYGVEVGDSFRPGSFTVEEGTYGFRVRAVDMAGNKSDWSAIDFDSSCKITYDATAPVVEITNPSDTDILSGTVDITGYVTDKNLSHYNIAIYKEGGDIIKENTEETSEFTEKTLYTWNTTDGNFPDGVYQIRLAAEDLAGNGESKGDSEHIISVTVDNTPPKTIIINEEISGIFTNAPILIEGNSTDDLSSVDSVNLYYKLSSDSEEEWIPINTIDNTENDSSFGWEYTWTPPQEGTYDIKASATDTLGNEEQSAYIYDITYDLTSPTVLFNLVFGVLKEVTAEDLLSGIYTIQISVDNMNTWVEYTPDMNLNDLVGNKPGTYTIHIRATDKAGNTTIESTTFTIPSPAPTITDTGEDILGAKDKDKSPLKPIPVQAYNGTGGYLPLSQADLLDTEEEQTNEEETITEDTTAVKGEEDNNGEPTKEEVTPEEEPTKWWIYPLVILPLLAIFLILWKRRKEEDEPQL